MNPRFEGLLILLGILIVVVLASVAAWQGKRKIAQRAGSVVLAIIACTAGLWAAGTAVLVLEDLSIPDRPVWHVIIAELVLWAIAIGLGLFSLKAILRPKKM